MIPVLFMAESISSVTPGITFVMTLLYHILDKAGNAMRDSIRYRIKADISGKAASLDYQELESQESMQLLL